MPCCCVWTVTRDELDCEKSWLDVVQKEKEKLRIKLGLESPTLRLIIPNQEQREKMKNGVVRSDKGKCKAPPPVLLTFSCEKTPACLERMKALTSNMCSICHRIFSTL